MGFWVVWYYQESCSTYQFRVSPHFFCFFCFVLFWFFFRTFSPVFFYAEKWCGQRRTGRSGSDAPEVDNPFRDLSCVINFLILAIQITGLPACVWYYRSYASSMPRDLLPLPRFPKYAFTRSSAYYTSHKSSFKGALDKYNIILQLSPKKVEIFILLEVLAWVMIACWILRSTCSLI